jgi:hypothetical protein
MLKDERLTRVLTSYESGCALGLRIHARISDELVLSQATSFWQI